MRSPSSLMVLRYRLLVRNLVRSYGFKIRIDQRSVNPPLIRIGYSTVEWFDGRVRTFSDIAPLRFCPTHTCPRKFTAERLRRRSAAEQRNEQNREGLFITNLTHLSPPRVGENTRGAKPHCGSSLALDKSFLTFTYSLFNWRRCRIGVRHDGKDSTLIPNQFKSLPQSPTSLPHKSFPLLNL